MRNFWLKTIRCYRKFSGGIIGALVFATPAAWANELYGPEAGVVPFAMGRAYSAVADDWLSLYYNPAGLALVGNVDLQIFNLGAGINSDTLTKYKDFGELGKSGSDAKKITALSGKHVFAKLSNNTQLTLPKFAASIFYDNTIGFDNRNNIYPRIRIRYTEDFGFQTGFGVGLGKGNNRTKAFRLGASLKYMKRKGGIKELTVAQLSAQSSSILQQFDESGWAFGVDVGMQYQLPISGRTEYTVSLVYHDIGKTSFGDFTQVDRPTRLEENIVAGLAVRFPIGGKVNRRKARRFGSPRSANHLTFAADYSHMNIPQGDEHFVKRLHVGMNLDLPVFSIQFGLNQTSITYGLTFDAYAFRISAASYGEDIAGYAGQLTDRRYLISISSNFSFGGL